MKQNPKQMVEGQEAFDRFREATKKMLSVYKIGNTKSLQKEP